MKLLKVEEAAKSLGVPIDSLRNAADTHGMTIKFGRAVRLHPNDLEELVELCRVNPKARASIGAKEKTLTQSGKSATTGMLESRPAQTTANKLKRNSRSTSRASSGQVAHFPQRK